VIHRWPDAEDLLAIKAEHTGPQARVRDAGILVAVARRPHAYLIDRFVYRTKLDRGAALLHAITCWRPLDAWNSGLAWGAARRYLLDEGMRVTMPDGDRMRLVVDMEDGQIDSVYEVSERLAPHLELGR
jgi:death on curing protein